MTRRIAAFLIAAAALALAACAQRPPVNAAVTLAQASSQRGAQAFARGDLVAAQRDYATALHVHESLGDTPGRAAALLSLARIAAQAGRPADALAAVDQVLADQAVLDVPTQVTAHGRAAALHLSQGDAAKADGHLAQASALCSAACPDAGALAVLRARSALVRQQPDTAMQIATAALTMPQLAATTPPTLQAEQNAERANALRVQAQAGAALGRHQAAAASAAAALELDRALGLADRVLLDLQLLAAAHRALGSDAQAQQYQTLADRAEAASRSLRGSAQ
ncbi:MAG: hypothetical protein EOO28_23300 [Comamonadaceae bacterium]|nr:MAG: hypothetical protein EOO28_23300 [Comamonadaceae bacterium]